MNRKKELEIAVARTEANLRDAVARLAAEKIDRVGAQDNVEKYRNLCRQARAALNQFNNQPGEWIG